MAALFTILIIVFAALVLLTIYITKKLLKGIYLAITVLSIGSIIFFFMLQADASDLNKRFATEDKLFVFVQDGAVTAAFIAATAGEPNIIENPAELSALNQQYQNKDFSEAVEKVYKVLVVDEQSFASVGSVTVADLTLTKQQVFDLIKSDTAADDFLQLYGDAGVVFEEMSA